jgi:hypothetical protein
MRDARCEMRDARCEMRDARCDGRVMFHNDAGYGGWGGVGRVGRVLDELKLIRPLQTCCRCTSTWVHHSLIPTHPGSFLFPPLPSSSLKIPSPFPGLLADLRFRYRTDLELDSGPVSSSNADSRTRLPRASSRNRVKPLTAAGIRVVAQGRVWMCRGSRKGEEDDKVSEVASARIGSYRHVSSH